MAKEFGVPHNRLRYHLEGLVTYPARDVVAVRNQVASQVKCIMRNKTDCVSFFTQVALDLARPPGASIGLEVYVDACS